MEPWHSILSGAALAVVAAIPLWASFRRGALYLRGSRGWVDRWRRPREYWRGIAISGAVFVASIGMMLWGLVQLR